MRLLQTIKADSYYSSICIEHEVNADRIKSLSVKEYLKEIKPYLKDIINNISNLIIDNIYKITYHK